MQNDNFFTWQFQKMGGNDQVVLLDAESLRHLSSLDPKLWAALSCPASGLNFDDRVLELLDTDEDGRIRIREVLAAVNWTNMRLADPASILRNEDVLHLADLSQETEEGRAMNKTAKALLTFFNKGDTDGLRPEDLTQAAGRIISSSMNGDGILPPLEELDADVRQFINDAVNVMGGFKDASGKIGMNSEGANSFYNALKKWSDWCAGIDANASPAGGDTAEAWELMRLVKPKVDDFYLRCELAAYAPQSATSLNPAQELFAPKEGENMRLLSLNELKELPLAHVDASGELPLNTGLNPAWRTPVRRLAEITDNLRGGGSTMTKEQWQALEKTFEPYATAVALKPATPTLKTDTPPSMPLEKLGEERISAILKSDVLQRFDACAAKDADMPAAAHEIADLERLVLYHAHLGRLLRNFVSFSDFYSLERNAAFQAGTLYIDGRSCLLCLPVDNIDLHADLAQRGQIFLLYCECCRVETVNGEEQVKTMNIAASVTAGSSRLLLTGRNGVFVDNDGKDWDVTVTKRVSNPIDLWQAVWEPYRAVSRMIEEQANKFASSRKEKVETAAAKSVSNAAAAATTPTSASVTPAKFDIGRNVGIFAAVGLALGAIGTALGTLVGALFSLTWWQVPLVFAGFFLIISGPSVIMAWLKLRKRTLGPLLEASGWAVNNQASINLALGKLLTQTATLPDNARRNRRDPLKKTSRWPWLVLLLILVAGAVGGWWWYDSKYGSSAGTGQRVDALGQNAVSADRAPRQNAPKNGETDAGVSNAAAAPGDAKAASDNTAKAGNGAAPTGNALPQDKDAPQ